jgi:enoyl-CoA hydratase
MGCGIRNWEQNMTTPSTYTEINISTEDAVRIITINRTHRRNAVDQATAIELFQAFEEFDRDDSLSVAILTGAEGYFCAGADLQALSKGEPNRIQVEGRIGPMGPTRMRLSKPVIAAIEGYAVAGGLELAIWCDMRVMAENAVMGVFCRRFGVPLVDLGTVRLPRLIGHSRAMDLILTGREINAQEALSFGLANRVVEKGRALEAALLLAKQLSKLPQTCLRSDRLSALEQWDLDEPSAIRNEMFRGLATVNSGETLEGASAFTKGAGRHGGLRE